MQALLTISAGFCLGWSMWAFITTFLGAVFGSKDTPKGEALSIGWACAAALFFIASRMPA